MVTKLYVPCNERKEYNLVVYNQLMLFERILSSGTNESINTTNLLRLETRSQLITDCLNVKTFHIITLETIAK